MSSESVRFLGHPRETKPTLGALEELVIKNKKRKHAQGDKKKGTRGAFVCKSDGRMAIVGGRNFSAPPCAGCLRHEKRPAPGSRSLCFGHLPRQRVPGGRRFSSGHHQNRPSRSPRPSACWSGSRRRCNHRRCGLLHGDGPG